MSDPNALANLGKLVAGVHGWPAAKAFKAYQPSDRDKAMIAAKAADVLKLFPPADDAATAISAAFAVHLERDLVAPVQLVEGTFALIGGASLHPIRHSWVMIGPYVADIAIFRMAYSRAAPVELTRHVYKQFGADRGLLFAAWRETRRFRVDYRPSRVLAGDEIDGLLVRARDLIEPATAQ
jgi:hypothetical protein